MAVWFAVASLLACGGDAGRADVVTGLQLLAGDLDVQGVTSDDFAAVLDQSRGALAVPIAGGNPQIVDPNSDSAFAFKNLIVSSHGFDFVADIGDLTVWTAAGGAVPLATASAGVLAVSDDGSRILVTQGSSSDATMTNLVVAGVDGSPPVMVAGVSRASSCSPRAAFAGGRFVVTHCDPGSSSVTVSSVDPATGAAVDLLTSAKNTFSVLPGPSARAAVVSATGDAFFVPITGGTLTPIGGNVEGIVATLDGTAVLLRGQGVLRRVPSDGSAATTLVEQGVDFITDVSPDGTQLLFRSTQGPRFGYGDLFATSALAQTTVTTLASTLDAATFGDAFTADSSRILFITQADDLFVGVLQSESVGGGAATIHGRAVWLGRGYADTRIVFSGDTTTRPDRPGLSVLRAVDSAADKATPTVIATSAGATFFLTQARDRVVFSFNDGGDRAGIYAAPLP